MAQSVNANKVVFISLNSLASYGSDECFNEVNRDLVTHLKKHRATVVGTYDGIQVRSGSVNFGPFEARMMANNLGIMNTAQMPDDTPREGDAWAKSKRIEALAQRFGVENKEDALFVVTHERNAAPIEEAGFQVLAARVAYPEALVDMNLHGEKYDESRKAFKTIYNVTNDFVLRK